MSIDLRMSALTAPAFLGKDADFQDFLGSIGVVRFIFIKFVDFVHFISFDIIMHLVIENFIQELPEFIILDTLFGQL